MFISAVDPFVSKKEAEFFLPTKESYFEFIGCP